ncbi:MAG: maleylacetoacetate isomerase [Sphingomonadaceae bacterium]
MELFAFFRSTASWRVRIAMNLKNVPHDIRPVALRQGEHRGADYCALNPQGLLPALRLHDGAILTQSLAICEYLEELYPDPPILPADLMMRARARAIAQIVACDIHPIQNPKIVQRLKSFGPSDADGERWAQLAIEEGFDAIERLLGELPGRFAVGAQPSLADICLVPQIANARRFHVALRWPRIEAIEHACNQLPAFRDAAPEHQPDAV